MKDFIFRKTLGLFVKTNGFISKRIFSGLGHIFIMHRVLPDKLRDRYTLNRDLAVTPEYLDWFISHLKRNNYDFLSLDEIHHKLSIGEQFKRKFAVLTIDDGYRDNIEYGLPVFKKHDAPFTIYVTNCFPEGTAVLWWYLLEEAMLKSNTFLFSSPGHSETFSWAAEDEKRKAFNNIKSLIIKTSGSDFDEMIRRTFKTEHDTVEQMCREIALTWEELRQLKSEPLLEIGAHTLHHYSLAYLTAEMARREIHQSKIEIEKQIGKKVNHFAYPYGGFADAGPREYQLCAEAGFKTSVINYSGNIFPQSKRSFQCLPRIPLSNHISTERLNNIMNGIEHFSFNGFRKTINQSFA